MCPCALVFLLAALPALAGPRGGPSFYPRQQTALVARAGEAAALRCRVLRLADRAVSWIRSSDLQILTHAGAVFTADSRVSCSEAPAGPDPDDFGDAAGELPRGPDGALTSRDGGRGPAGRGAVHSLRIERLRPADSGRYECQINTEPKMSLFFNLTVADAAPAVWLRAGGADGAGGEVWGAAGGAVRLTCEAGYEAGALPAEAAAALPPLRIRWERDGRPLDSQGAPGVSLDAEWWGGRARSRLTLARAAAADAGEYACGAGGRRRRLLLRLRRPDRLRAADGELEGMQRDEGDARGGGGTRLAPRGPRLLPLPLPPLPLPLPLLLLLPLCLT